MATTLGKFVIHSLGNLYNNISVHLWSDSQIVLYWIHSEKKLKQFVAHQVQEITQTFPITLWNYCPTGDNPADLLTRGTTSAALSTSLWTNGPSWLSHESKWPQWNSALTLHLQTDNTEAEQVDPTEPSTGIHKIIDLSKYSTLTKLLRVTGYVLRFITNLRDSKVLGNICLLQTIVTEIEAVLNDCPIPYMSSDVSDPEPLTPSHLLYGHRIVPLPYPATDGSEIYDPNYGETTGASLRTRVAQHAQVLQHFQHCWK